MSLSEKQKQKIIDIYNEYIHETDNIKDIMRWCTKRSVSKSILKCKGYTQEDIKNKVVRRNETVVWDAVKDIPVQEGDKIYLYPVVLSSTIERKEYKNGKVKEKVIKTVGLKRGQIWNNDHDSDKLKERINDTISILSGVLDTKSIIGAPDET